MSDLVLGIEIGGTKLQLGVGSGETPELLELCRLDIDRAGGAQPILDKIAIAGAELAKRWPVRRVSYGFGGPVDASTGTVVTSHQVAGWAGFPLGDWTLQHLGLPAVVANDCDMAALGEAVFGAGRGASIMFYVTVGTGIGGGLVIDGQLFGSGRPAVAEIGHLRPGLDCTPATSTLEGIASGPAIEAEVMRQLHGQPGGSTQLEAVLRAAGRVSCEDVAAAAAAGDAIARDAIAKATRALGWGLAQVMTLLAPNVIAVGGGVSLMPESLFLNPVRTSCDECVFSPLRGSCEIVPAMLGEAVVVHGAIVHGVRS